MLDYFCILLEYSEPGRSRKLNRSMIHYSKNLEMYKPYILMKCCILQLSSEPCLFVIMPLFMLPYTGIMKEEITLLKFFNASVANANSILCTGLISGKVVAPKRLA